MVEIRLHIGLIKNFQKSIRKELDYLVKNQTQVNLKRDKKEINIPDG